MNNADEKIVKALEELQSGQKALQVDMQKQGRQIETLIDVQEQQWKQIAQHGKTLAGLLSTLGTMLEEQHTQRLDIRSLHTDMQSLHTETQTSKEELKTEILSARAEAKADSVDLKATVMKPLKDHEQRIDALEDDAGIPHPDKN